LASSSEQLDAQASALQHVVRRFRIRRENQPAVQVLSRQRDPKSQLPKRKEFSAPCAKA
jgi:hypothetical protein